MLLIGALYWKQSTLYETGKRISWSIFGFIAGMVIVVRSIEDTGLTTMFGSWLLKLSGGTTPGAVIVGTAGAALGTNLINNVPMAVVMASALGSIQHAPMAIQHAVGDAGPIQSICRSGRSDDEDATQLFCARYG